MSIKVMSWVWDTEIKPPRNKMVLLAMADYAADSGEGIWPSVETLCKKTGLSDRTVRRATLDLESAGVLIKQGETKYQTNLWKINTGWEPPVSVTVPEEDETPVSVTVPPVSVTVPPVSVTDNPSVEPSVEPSEKPLHPADAFLGPATTSQEPISKETPEERLARMRSKFGSDPVSVAAHCASAIEREGSWTAPPAAGGSSSSGSPMLEAWLEGKGIDKRDVAPEKLAEWMSRLDRLAATMPPHVTPGQMAAAVRRLLDKNGPHAWYNYADPAVAKFKQDWAAAVYEALGQDRKKTEKQVTIVHSGNGPGYKEYFVV